MTLEEQIKEKLLRELNPSHLEVINESHLHKGHAGDDGTGQTHFRVVLSVSSFSGLSRIQAHQKVYSVLSQEMEQGVHALAIKIL